MYLTQDQAYIILCEFTNLSYSQIRKELDDNFKKHSTGQYSILLMPGNKLKYDKKEEKFFLSSYHYSEHDNLYVYDFLGLLWNYWDMTECDIEFSENSAESIERKNLSLEFKKISYEGYKKSIEYQVA